MIVCLSKVLWNALECRSYDVDDQDSFWTAHAGDQFPEVLNAASWMH